jgi:hypothetical protein
MNAAQIAATLGDPRREGSGWRCPVPFAWRPFFSDPRRGQWPSAADLLGRL